MSKESPDATNLIAVTGGTGELGRHLVRRLRRAGRPVRVISRRRRPEPAEAGLDWATADLVRGDALGSALAGAGTVVHCATRYRPAEEARAAANLISVARAAGVGHLVLISIVGADRVPLPYYRGKVAVERAVADSGIPYSLLRTTQFHELLRAVLAPAARPPVMPVFDLPFQPIAADTAAAALADLALDEPRGRVPDRGGPEVTRLPELARAFLAATGRRRTVLRLRLPGRTFAAYRRGEHLAPDGITPGPTFLDHLSDLADPLQIGYGRRRR